MVSLIYDIVNEGNVGFDFKESCAMNFCRKNYEREGCVDLYGRLCLGYWLEFV